MRSVRVTLAILVPTLLSGCGYIHFGRLEKSPVGGGDAALAAAYSNLSTEHKILKQELLLARKEGDALRTALERGTGASAGDAAARLDETTKELAALRLSYAKLQAERASSNIAVAADSPRLRELEDKLAVSLRNYTQLQEENTRLRGDLERTRGDNVALADQLKTAAARNEQAQSALEMLNVELLAQKQARARADQAADSARAQLSVVLAKGAGDATTGQPVPATTAALQLSRSPSAGATPTAELRTDAERLRRTSESTAVATTPITPRPAVHVVAVGDTLEKLAVKYYGAAERWRAIYEANLTLLGGGQALRIGMELKLP